MENITPLMLDYREAARHLWNVFLREEDTPGGGAISTDAGVHDWEALKQLLFTALVLRKCGHDECAAMLVAPGRFGFSWIEPIAHIRVVPTTEVRVLISRDSGKGGYWDHPVDRLGPGDADLRFIDFFDFGQAGYLDFRYYEAVIESSARHSALAGHRALIEVGSADVFVVPPTAANDRGPG